MNLKENQLQLTSVLLMLTMQASKGLGSLSGSPLAAMRPQTCCSLHSSLKSHSSSWVILNCGQCYSSSSHTSIDFCQRCRARVPWGGMTNHWYAYKSQISNATIANEALHLKWMLASSCSLIWFTSAYTQLHVWKLNFNLLKSHCYAL